MTDLHALAGQSVDKGTGDAREQGARIPATTRHHCRAWVVDPCVKLTVHDVFLAQKRCADFAQGAHHSDSRHAMQQEINIQPLLGAVTFHHLQRPADQAAVCTKPIHSSLNAPPIRDPAVDPTLPLKSCIRANHHTPTSCGDPTTTPVILRPSAARFAGSIPRNIHKLHAIPSPQRPPNPTAHGATPTNPLR